MVFLFSLIVSVMISMQCMDSVGWQDFKTILEQESRLAEKTDIWSYAQEFGKFAYEAETAHMILVIPDINNSKELQSQLIKESKTLAQSIAIKEKSHVGLIIYKDITAKTEPDILTESTTFSGLLNDIEHHKVSIIAIGIGGCIAKASTRHSKNKIKALFLIAVPVLNGDNFKIDNCEKIFNLYSTSDSSQLESVHWSTLRKIAEEGAYNLRVLIRGEEPDKKKLYEVISILQDVLERLNLFKEHTDFDCNTCPDDVCAKNRLQVVIRTEKTYQEMASAQDSISDIKLSNTDADNFQNLYGKKISEKTGQLTVVFSVGWHALTGLFGK